MKNFRQDCKRFRRSEAKLSLIGSMASGLATNLSDLDLVLVLNDTYLEPQQCASRNSSGELMNIDENSCSNDIEISQSKVRQTSSHSIEFFFDVIP